MSRLTSFLESLTPTDWIGIGAGAVVVMLVLALAPSLLRRRSRLNTGPARNRADPFTDGGSSERRIAPRRRGNPVAVLVSDQSAQVEPVRGWVVDRSQTGLGLELEEEGEVDIGTVLSIRPVEGPTVPWVQIEVRNRKKHSGTWRLGCRFVRPPAYDVLMRFG